MGELSDRKDEDEVKEELHGGDLMVALPSPRSSPWACSRSIMVSSPFSLTGGLVDPIPVDLNPIIPPRTQRAFDVRL